MATAKKDTTSGSEIQSVGHKKRMLAAQGSRYHVAVGLGLWLRDIAIF